MEHRPVVPAVRVCPSRRSAWALAGFALLLSSFGPALPLAYGQSGDPSIVWPPTRVTPITPSDDPDLERSRERATNGRLGLEFWTSGIFDSNVDHDEADLDSYGATMAARARFRTRRFNLQYHGGVDRFTETVRWNRVTHRLGAEMRQRITSKWRANALVELSAGQSSEDREPLGAQYMLAPELEYRVDEAHRVTVYGRYIVRRFGGSEVRQEQTRQGGGELRRDAGGRQSWTLRYRYEVTDAPTVRNSYTRHAAIVNYRVRATRQDDLLLGLSFRPRRFPHRVLRLDAGDELRRDDRWTYRVGWGRELSDALRLEATYTVDHQDSNDVRKSFRAHRVALTTGWFIR